MRVKKKVREAGSRFWRAALAGVLALGLTPLPAFATELAPGEVELTPQVDAMSIDGYIIGTANAAANPAPEILGLSNPNMRNANEANTTYTWFGDPEVNESPNPFLYNYHNGLTPGIYIGAYAGNPMAALIRYVPGGSDDLSTNPQNAVWELQPSVILGTGYDDFPEGGDHDFYITRGDPADVEAALNLEKDSYQPIGVTYNRRTLADMTATMYRLAAAADEALAANKDLKSRYEDPMIIAANYERYILGQKGLVLKAIADGTVTKKTIALVQSYDSDAKAYTIIPEGVAETTATTNRYLEAVQGVTVNYFNEVADASATTATVTADQLKDNVDFIIIGGQVGDAAAAQAALGEDGLLDNAFFCTNWSNGASFGTVMNSVENAQNVGRILPCVYPSVLDQSDMIAYYYDAFYHIKDGKVAELMADRMDGVRNWNAKDSASYTTWELSDYEGYNRASVEAALQEGAEWLAANGRLPSYLVPTTHIVESVKVPDPVAVQGLTYNGKMQSGVVSTNGYIVENGTAKLPGTYTATVTLEEGYTWADGTTDAKTVDYSIAPAKVDPPTAIALSYTGEEQTGVAAATGYTVENGTALKPGAYTATATLAEGYEWSDGTTEPKQVEFSMTGDINKITVNKFDASYAYTGEEIVIAPSFKDGDIKFTLNEGTDYTVTVTQNGSPATLKELGEYEVTLAGMGLWSGTITKTVKVVPYFTVYVKEAGGEATVAKSYNQGEFAALKSASSDPISALWNAGATGWNVASTNEYVTFADLVANVQAAWGEGYMVVWEGKNGATTSYTYEELQATKFFPAAVGSGTHDTAGAVAAPLVFALKQGGSTINTADPSAPQNAAAAQTAALAAASANGCPRTIVGISEADYADPSATGAKTAGMRLWNNINAVTIVKMASVDKPTGKTLTYNGKEQTGVAAGTGYALSGNTATNAGSYTATATLEEGFVWSDGSTGPIEVTYTINPASIAKATVALAKKSATYNGKAQSSAVKTVVLSGKTLVSGTDFTATAAKGTKAGKYTATVTGKGNYTGKATATFTINKAANTFAFKAVKATQTATYGKAKTILAKKAFKVTKNKSKGKVTYKKAKGNKKIVIAKTGKITVKKGLKKGTYTVKVKATSAATTNYKAASKTISFKVKVK